VYPLKVESRLHMERIPRMAGPDFELPGEVKAFLGDSKYGQAVRDDTGRETTAVTSKGFVSQPSSVTNGYGG
jgi:hypothetical protein